MSAAPGSAAALQAALVAALAQAEGIAGVAGGVFDPAPPRAAFPYLTIGDTASSDWSTKTEPGREHRVTICAWDEAGRSARLLALASAIETTVEGLARALDGHRIASVALLRSRLVRPARGPWCAQVDFRVRTQAA